VSRKILAATRTRSGSGELASNWCVNDWYQQPTTNGPKNHQYRATPIGDPISDFMKTLGQSNLVIVALSAKYLHFASRFA
jgi:hypothetical protein